jgi:hypothetical protein
VKLILMELYRKRPKTALNTDKFKLLLTSEAK